MKKIIAKIYLKKEEQQITIENLTCDIGELTQANVNETTTFGVYSNRGSIKFNTNNSYIISSVKSGSISKSKVEFYVKDTKTYTEKPISKMIVKSYSYDENNNEVNLEVSDSLESLQSEKQSLYLFEEKYLSDVLSELNKNQKKIYDTIEPHALNYISNTRIYCPHLEKDNYWSLANKVCEASLCRVYESNGQKVIRHVLDKNNNEWIIHPNNIYHISPASKTEPIESVSISAKNRKKYQDSVIATSQNFHIYDVDASEDRTDLKWSFVGDQKTTNPSASIDVNVTKDETTQYGSHYTMMVDVASSTDFSKRNIYKLRRFQHKGHKWFSVGKENTSAGIDSYGGDAIETLSATNGELEDYNNYDLDLNLWTLRFKFIGVNKEERFRGDNIGYNIDIFSDVVAEAYGDYFEDLTDKVYNTSSSEDPVNLSTNELIQTNNTIFIDGETKNHGQYIVDKVLSLFSMPLECREIECGYGDYANGDVVIPFVIRKGEEVPLSTYNDGSAKKFEILGLKYSYNGVIRQKLYLRELKL